MPRRYPLSALYEARKLAKEKAESLVSELAETCARAEKYEAALRERHASARRGIIAEAGLSYIGLGVQPPDQSWGRLLNEAQTLVAAAPHLVIFPGLAILLAVLGFNLLGEGLHAAFDPCAGKA